MPSGLDWRHTHGALVPYTWPSATVTADGLLTPTMAALRLGRLYSTSRKPNAPMADH